MRQHEFNVLLGKLKDQQIPVSDIGPTIVALAKPFNAKRIREAKTVVASYLTHTDSWVRHEAMWFLASWAKLPEYQPAVLWALRHDPESDNRGFAALCVAHMCKGNTNPDITRVLVEAVTDVLEDELVRLSAYGALLEVVADKSGVDFFWYYKGLQDIDLNWIGSLTGGNFPAGQ